MADRQPFQLKPVLVIYNFSVAALNLYIAIEVPPMRLAPAPITPERGTLRTTAGQPWHAGLRKTSAFSAVSRRLCGLPPNVISRSQIL
ncbi:hypothetical protein HPB48_004987 [Haemaphysalis longicornis]|uniref:Uncharacterized protein n=1 Tax=Haemaphysalis longicornis TaxID=44386 RepID=A0A9J6GCZ6_HAELO|nr:hypothetical protein HPB48_004987 [Haemaphysalis longicornis]